MANESFKAKYQPVFDQKNNKWIILIPNKDVKIKSKNFYEISLPIYAGRALAIGGNILRPKRKEYRDWLLDEQGGICAICGKGAEAGNPWNLDHQPPMSEPMSRFIDYEKVTQNRVIHRNCDSAQTKKSTGR